MFLQMYTELFSNHHIMTLKTMNIIIVLELYYNFLTANPKIKLILWTSTCMNEIDKYIHVMEKDYIKFDFINYNYDVKDTDIQYFGDKLYFNVGLDDKFGFDPEKDWADILEYLKK